MAQRKAAREAAAGSDSELRAELGEATASTRQGYDLRYGDGRIHAVNGEGKVIDLGALRKVGRSWRYELDSAGRAVGGFDTPEEALEDLASSLRFLWLDGQFTAVADERGRLPQDFEELPKFHFELDELAPGEPLVDAAV